MRAEYDFSKGVRGKYSAERKVRDAWEAVAAAHTYYPGTAWTVFIYGPPENKERATLKAITGVNKHEAWQDALAFTQKRQQEIAEIEEEITAVAKFYSFGRDKESDSALKRVYDRLLAQLAELKRGMKV